MRNEYDIFIYLDLDNDRMLMKIVNKCQNYYYDQKKL